MRVVSMLCCICPVLMNPCKTDDVSMYCLLGKHLSFHTLYIFHGKSPVYKDHGVYFFLRQIAPPY